MKEKLDSMLGQDVCLHTFSKSSVRGTLTRLYGRYWLEYGQEIIPGNIHVIEGDHIFMKRFNGRDD